MKKLKLLFNVSEAALTAAVFVLVTALVPMEIGRASCRERV